MLGVPVLTATLASAPPASASAGTSSCDPAQHFPSGLAITSASWKVCVDGSISESSPTVATYNGQTILAVGDENGLVHVINAATGQELPGWPQKMAAPAGERVAIESSPAIASLSGPGGPLSIVVGAGSTWVAAPVGEVEAFSITGAEEWVFHVGKAANASAGVISSPAVGDITGSGEQVVFGSWDHKMYVLNSAGHQLGFAYDNADTIWSSPALYRLPGQTRDDVYIGSDASGRPYTNAAGQPSRCVGGFVTDYVWSADAVDPDTLAHGPGLTRRWFQCLNQSIWSSPAVGILTNAHRPAVVIGTGYFEQPFPSATDRIFAFDALTGKPIRGWPVRTTGPTFGSPAIGPINSSGAPGVVDISWNCNGPRQSDCFVGNSSTVVAYSAAGKRLWKTQLPGPTALGSPILVPLQGETWDDVIVGTPNGIYPLDGTNGAPLFGTNKTNQFAAINSGCRVFNTPAVADVSQAGAGTGWQLFDACGGPAAFNTDGEIAAYSLPTAPTTAPAWPMWRQNPNHDGLALGTPG